MQHFVVPVKRVEDGAIDRVEDVIAINAFEAQRHVQRMVGNTSETPLSKCGVVALNARRAVFGDGVTVSVN